MSITLETISDQLNGLRMDIALLAAQVKPAPRTYSAQSSGSGQETGVPQPHSLVDDPASVQVHFGKNNGVAIGKLSERSLGWYAQEPEPRLDSSGKAFPPRPQDVALRNACRQLWHQQKGTLGDSGAATAKTDSKPQAATAADENVPF
jgi:hypothetical protein